MKHVKFIKRVNKWFASHWRDDRIEKQKALSSEGYHFLKTTGRPCNCAGCTYLKYKRENKYKILQNEFAQ